LLRQAGAGVDRREGKKASTHCGPALPENQPPLLRPPPSRGRPAGGIGRSQSLDRILQKRRRVSEQYFNLTPAA